MIDKIDYLTELCLIQWEGLFILQSAYFMVVTSIHGSNHSFLTIKNDYFWFEKQGQRLSILKSIGNLLVSSLDMSMIQSHPKI